MPRPTQSRTITANDLRSVELLLTPPAVLGLRKYRGKNNTVHRGLLHEQRVATYLELRYPNDGSGPAFIFHPWLRYKLYSRGAKPFYAQPDGFLLDLPAGKITLLEIKLRHSHDAWWQLRHLYEPLLRFLFSERSWRFACCECVRWYDAERRVPEDVIFTSDPASLIANAYGVHITHGASYAG